MRRIGLIHAPFNPPRSDAHLLLLAAQRLTCSKLCSDAQGVLQQGSVSNQMSAASVNTANGTSMAEQFCVMHWLLHSFAARPVPDFADLRQQLPNIAQCYLAPERPTVNVQPRISFDVLKLGWPQTNHCNLTGGHTQAPRSTGCRGAHRGRPPHGWRGPLGTQTPLPQASATALPSPRSSRHCLRLLADGRVMQAERRLVEAMPTGWHSNLLLLLQLPLEATIPANTMLA